MHLETKGNAFFRIVHCLVKAIIKNSLVSCIHQYYYYYYYTWCIIIRSTEKKTHEYTVRTIIKQHNIVNKYKFQN